MPTPYSRVTIVGDGAMGTVCALLLNDLGTEVSLWSAFPSQAEDMRRERENRRFLPGFAIPISVAIADDPAEAFVPAPDMILSAVPCQFMRSVWTKLAPYVQAAQASEGWPLAGSGKRIQKPRGFLDSSVQSTENTAPC